MCVCEDVLVDSASLGILCSAAPCTSARHFMSGYVSRPGSRHQIPDAAGGAGEVALPADSVPALSVCVCVCLQVHFLHLASRFSALGAMHGRTPRSAALARVALAGFGGVGGAALQLSRTAGAICAESAPLRGPSAARSRTIARTCKPWREWAPAAAIAARAKLKRVGTSSLWECCCQGAHRRRAKWPGPQKTTLRLFSLGCVACQDSCTLAPHQDEQVQRS